MKKYQIEIIEKLRKVVSIDADNLVDAQEKVKNLYEKKEIELNHNDLLRTEINNVSIKDLEEFCEQIISTVTNHERKLYSERIKASRESKKQKLDTDVNKKNQEMER